MAMKNPRRRKRRKIKIRRNNLTLLQIYKKLLFAERVIKLSEYRKNLSIYLHKKMRCAALIQSLIRYQIGAGLVLHAAIK